MVSNCATLFEQCNLLFATSEPENLAQTIYSISPFYNDYLAIKPNYPKYFVLVRLNDGYFTFRKDAQKVAKMLGLEVVTRESFLHAPTQVCFLPLQDFAEHFQYLTQSGAGVVLVNHDPNKGLETFVVLSVEDALKAQTPSAESPVTDNFEQVSIF